MTRTTWRTVFHETKKTIVQLREVAQNRSHSLYGFNFFFQYDTVLKNNGEKQSMNLQSQLVYLFFY